MSHSAKQLESLGFIAVAALAAALIAAGCAGKKAARAPVAQPEAGAAVPSSAAHERIVDEELVGPPAPPSDFEGPPEPVGPPWPDESAAAEPPQAAPERQAKPRAARS
jgi:hypothetical protein